MGKVSIGLRGWRFDEEAVFDADGRYRPLEEMPDETATRISRLTALVGSPCDACWLLHGDDNLEECAPADAVYGEPGAEVLLCADHEVDFLYWYREEGGEDLRGTDAFQAAFHEWFADGGRAPEGFEGIEHVDTAPADVPNPPTEQVGIGVETDRVDLRELGRRE